MSYWSLMEEAISAWAVPGQINTPADYRGVNDGVWVGDSAYADGLYGRCFDLDGNASLNCGDVYSLPAGGDLTFFCRVWWDASSTQTIAYLGGQSNAYLAGYAGKLQDDASAGGYVGDNNGTIPLSIGATTRDVWHPVVTRYTAATGQARYRIGDETETVVASANQTSAPEFWIGSRAAAFPLEGRAAEYAVWNRSLSDGEESELIAGPEPTIVTPPNLIGDLVAGGSVQVDAGLWDVYGNGAASVAHRLQASPDGVSGWQDVSGTESAATYTIPLTLEGQSLRVVSVATNLGGDSDTAYSPHYVVDSAWPKAIVRARSLVVLGPVATRIRCGVGPSATAIVST